MNKYCLVSTTLAVMVVAGWLAGTTVAQEPGPPSLAGVWLATSPRSSLGSGLPELTPRAQVDREMFDPLDDPVIRCVMPIFPRGGFAIYPFEIVATGQMLVFLNEAFGMVFLEAAAAGLPVIAGNWRGVSEIVATGETGILIDPWDDVEFAQAVVDLIRDNPRRIAMAEAAAARAESKHGMTAAVTVLNQALAAAKAMRRGARQ